MDLKIKILSLNCWGVKYLSRHRVKRIQAIGCAIDDGDYDFVLLQEIWSIHDFETLKHKVENKLMYSHYFHSGAIGSGLCVFSKSPIIDSFYHPWMLNGYIYRIQHGDWFAGKGIGVCQVLHQGIIVNLFVAHLHAQYHSEKHDDYRAHRLAQAFEGAQFIKLVSPSADVNILGGDLNCEASSTAFLVINHLGGLQDSFTKAFHEDNANIGATSETPQNSFTSKSSLSRAPLGKRIDYILYSSQNQLKTEYPERNSAILIMKRLVQHSWYRKLQQVCSTNFQGCLENEHISVEESVPEPEFRRDLIQDAISICKHGYQDACNNQIFYLIISFVWLLSFSVVYLLQDSVPFWLTIILKAFEIISAYFCIMFMLLGIVFSKMESKGILQTKNGLELLLKNFEISKEFHTQRYKLHPLNLDSL